MDTNIDTNTKINNWTININETIDEKNYILKCYHCDEIFPNKEVLLRHQNDFVKEYLENECKIKEGIHLPPKITPNIKCSHCNQMFENIFEMRKHKIGVYLDNISDYKKRTEMLKNGDRLVQDFISKNKGKHVSIYDTINILKLISHMDKIKQLKLPDDPNTEPYVPKMKFNYNLQII